MNPDHKTFILYVRNFIFGAEDSLVSTVSLLAGVVSAGVAQRDIVIAGIVLIFVEAFSMSVGSFLSERTTEESLADYKEEKSNTLFASVIMFFSYFVCGLVPLLPFVFLDLNSAFWLSIALSLVSLFALGFVSAKILKTNKLKSAFRMALLGGVAILLGVVVGILFK